YTRPVRGFEAIATSTSPPDAPVPDTALGWPPYLSAHALAPTPPGCTPCQTSVPDPIPRSEAITTLFAGDTRIAGSPSTLAPHPPTTGSSWATWRDRTGVTAHRLETAVRQRRTLPDRSRR